MVSLGCAPVVPVPVVREVALDAPCPVEREVVDAPLPVVREVEVSSEICLGVVDSKRVVR